MTVLPESIRILSKGIWLPIGRTIFFNPEKDRPGASRKDRDRAIIANYNLNDEIRPEEISGYRLSEIDPTIPKKLQSSVFYRLVTVLANDFHLTAELKAKRGYTV
jgi:hypothetical protein